MVRPNGGQQPPPPHDAGEAAPKRSYESPLRRQRAAQTRDRIVAAGAEMVHGFPSWDWRELTIRAVARRAEVNESTIYRYFATERGLHDAVMRHLEAEAGVDVEDLRLDNFTDVIARVYGYLSSFPVALPPTADPTFAAVDQRRREALVAAVAEAVDDWPEADQQLAAAMLDVFWSLPTFERLTTVWNLDPEQATRAVSWVVRLVEQAVQDGRGPDA